MVTHTERRKRVLTDADVDAIAEALANNHRDCVLGLSPEVAQALAALTPEQIGIMRRVMGVMGNAANAVGVMIVVGIAGTIFALMTKGFWAALAKGLKGN